MTSQTIKSTFNVRKTSHNLCLSTCGTERQMKKLLVLGAVIELLRVHALTKADYKFLWTSDVQSDVRCPDQRTKTFKGLLNK